MATTFYLYNDDILKYRPHRNDFLRMTGWDKRGKSDRRIPETDVNKDTMIKLKTHKALELINKYWDSNITKWEYKGNKYDNSCAVDSNQPTHIFVHSYINRNNEQCSHSNEYIIIWHQGHIYWAFANTYYYPQMELMEFKDINTEPQAFVKWTNISHCKAIRNIKSKKII